MRMALAKTSRNQLVSVVKLYKALGGGWAPKNAEEQRTTATTQDAGSDE